RVECGNPRHLRNHGHRSSHLVRAATRGVRMKFATWLLVLVLIAGIFSTHRSVRRSRGEAERYFALRLAIFSWLAAFGFIIALIFLPNRQRVLLMIPIFLAAVSIAKLWRDGRARLRREHEERDRFERMKRIN